MEEKKSKIAVSALVMKDDKFLLLKRRHSPYKWGPPAGRVREGETFIEALVRETKEEANIEIKVLMPIDVWCGNHENEAISSVSFACEYDSGEIKVSEEHSEAKWFVLDEIKNENVTHDFKDFVRATRIKKLFNNGEIK
ncbi:MAG: NUDIX hydrolase [Patescibacteria group bacterium]